MSKAFKAVTGTLTGVLPNLKSATGTERYRAGDVTIDPKAFQEMQRTKETEMQARDMEMIQQARSAQSQAQQQAARGQQQDFITQLQAQAAGAAPSLAEAQLRQAGDRSLAQQLAAAAATRGAVNQGALARQLAQSQAAQGADLAQQAVQARMQEQQAAQQMLGGQLQNLRGQDISVLSQADQAQLAALGQAGQLAQAQDLGLQDLQKLNVQSQLGAKGIQANLDTSAAANRANMFGGLMNSAGSALALLSDKKEKTKIKKSNDSDKFLTAISSKPQKTDMSRQIDSELDNFYNKWIGSTQQLETSKSQSGEGASAKDMLAGAQKLFGDKGTAKLPISQTASSTGGMTKSVGSQLVGFLTSDKKAKKHVKEEAPKNFLDALTGYSYEYKNPEKPGAAEGRQYSVMAQDLEKAGPVGQSMVTEAQDGTKMVDYARGFGVMLAAQADLNKRLKELESLKSKSKKSKEA